MNKALSDLFRELKERGMSAGAEEDILRELNREGDHLLPAKQVMRGGDVSRLITEERSLYLSSDLTLLQSIFAIPNYIHVLKSLDELLRRDERRAEDGFPRKIRLGKIVKPSPTGKNRVVVVPTVVEEKFLHDTRSPGNGEETGGSGEGREGEVIGEEPVHSTGEAEAAGAGEGGETGHEIESTAYDLGRILTEEFHLPNIKDKGKKRSLTRFTYELTDRNRGFGQLLDKKATLRRIIETNLALGNIPDYENIDPANLLVSPEDRVYRTLSRERDYESQAVVFFVRDYSGSMQGKPTELVVSQHLLIYTWLAFQYENNVETRFILHDTDAREVEDFYSYYNTSVAGGTRLSSAYRLVNEIVEKENLAADYNIYVFQGTDGEDWDDEGKEALEELARILRYVNRIGITIAENYYKTAGESSVEKYLQRSKLLANEKVIRMDSLRADSDQERIMEGIRKLVS